MTGGIVMTTAGFVGPDDVATLAGLLKRSGTEIESRIRGTSMLPTLRPGAHVRIRCGHAAAALGDVVAFLNAGGLMGHRLVARRRGYLITRGDGSALCDPPIPATAVLGTLTAWRLDETDQWRAVPPSPPPVPAAVLGTSLVAKLLAVHPGLARAAAIVPLVLRSVLARVRQRLP